MNRDWQTQIVPGANVVTEWDDDKDVWKVIAVDGNQAWIRNKRTNKNMIEAAPFLYLTKRTK